MNNHSIAQLLRLIGLPQYISLLERHCYGLEGLLYVTEDDLRLMGVGDPDHITTIITYLKKQQPKTQPDTESTSTRRISQKFSLTSTLDLVKPSTTLFRQSIVPLLRRRDYKGSTPCLRLPPEIHEEDHAPSGKHRSIERKQIFMSGEFEGCGQSTSIQQKNINPLK
ncbi:hypothetical protein E1301_Tti022467 [Triplophysa tibetana]|uniref:SAM domain-containing protein n=1 Tax=Triplophysa tibetana TaxID=1572043 RepID=A0A5A9PID9_9TELE|nr:hypothetical protein E1301_Tti022467 [Triplophysa tibetana]